MNLIERYIVYIRDIRRYSGRTVQLYADALQRFVTYVTRESGVSVEITDDELLQALNRSEIRSYEVSLMNSRPPLQPKTVNLHISVISGFCNYLVKEGYLVSNPVRLVPRPKVEKRLPEFYRTEAMEAYFKFTSDVADEDSLAAFVLNPESRSAKKAYNDRLSRLIISMLYSLGLRRSELIGLDVGNVDFGRKIVKVHGKGDKTREIPLILSLSEEILLYLKAVEALCGGKRSLTDPLLVTYGGRRLYPAYVDRTVKSELGDREGITGRRSPHVLRHSLATTLLDQGSDLNSIKELLGHSSLAATQVYTHNSIARLKNIYEQAHPRAKNGGKHGD